MRFTYKCDRCLKEIDYIHGMNDRPEVKCSCGNVMFRKIQPPIVYYKADGFACKDGKL